MAQVAVAQVAEAAQRLQKATAEAAQRLQKATAAANCRCNRLANLQLLGLLR